MSDEHGSQIQSQTDTTGLDDEPTGEYVSTLPGILGTIDILISKIEAVMLAVGVLLMAANTIANVVGRFVFQNSIFFSEELNRILIILITFAGISYAARHGRHIRMSAIYDIEPGEVVVFSWVTWPDRATADACFGKMQDDPDFANMDMPFDGKRMMWGGFSVAFEGKA